MRPHRRQPTKLPCPWDSPGKNTGVGCHFPLQCLEVKSESEVAQSCLTLSDPMDCGPPGSSVHGIFQARVVEWGAIVLVYIGGISILCLSLSLSSLLNHDWKNSFHLSGKDEYSKIGLLFLRDIYALSWSKFWYYYWEKPVEWLLHIQQMWKYSHRHKKEKLRHTDV